jgi:hypothetical protein
MPLGKYGELGNDEDYKKKSLTLEHFESATLLAHYIPHLQISKKSRRIVSATKDKFFVIT